jgi:MOSC domain-containing protein YiiM
VNLAAARAVVAITDRAGMIGRSAMTQVGSRMLLVPPEPTRCRILRVDSEQPVVVSVNLQAKHRFSKTPAERIELIAGLGVEGDAHAGATVQHRSRKRWSPSAPNLRQVHLMHAELFDELKQHGFDVKPGQLGENVTTRDLDLLNLPTGTLLHLGPEAVIEITGLRNPCVQIDRFQPGLLKEVLDHDEAGRLIRKAGIMGIVLSSGPVKPTDPIAVKTPAEPHQPLKPV